ncbi:MAG: hypothetical protein K6B42_03120 [Clostridia bacterium]|nr:hypothetical protein [Clostridia bacterium]
MKETSEIKMHDRVRIKATGETAFIVWFNEDDPSQDSFLLELENKDEMPKYYKRRDFEIIGEACCLDDSDIQILTPEEAEKYLL